jgi:hypothetical protein
MWVFDFPRCLQCNSEIALGGFWEVAPKQSRGTGRFDEIIDRVGKASDLTLASPEGFHETGHAAAGSELWRRAG